MSDPKIDPNEEIIVNGVSFTHDDIYQVVDIFYTRIQEDPVLKIPFQSVHDWPDHIRRLTHFWWIRLGGQPYLFAQYNPVAKHFFAGFNAELLERWLKIFHEVLKENLSPEQCALWKLVSERMGQGLSFKNEMFKRAYEAERGMKTAHEEDREETEE